MTIIVTVSVNGPYKMTVKCGGTTTYVSGYGSDVPVSQQFNPYSHSDGSVFVIGPEEPDNGPDNTDEV